MKAKTIKYAFAILIASTFLISCSQSTGNANNQDPVTTDSAATLEEEMQIEAKNSLYPPIDSVKFRELNKALANGDTTGRWPAVGVPIPLPGAILPHKRIIAYYGNIDVKGMGALGEYAPEEMWNRLDKEVKKWNEADTLIEAIPALHYIAVVASGEPGKSGKYRNRMPFHQIDSVLTIAKMRDAIVFLDIQVGQGSLEEELPELEEYLKLPHVHLGIDPEFSMKDGSIPGKRIGSFNAADINYATDYLSKLVQEHNLPPKVFVVHRFTQAMVKNYKDIKRVPEVQFVLHMDGWGPPELKKGTYRHFIYPEPVEYTGFKIFYKNDIKNAPNRLITPEEVLALRPIPIYIQYQ
jgi:hypothetical protein